jgi:hypothetical protein
MDAHRLTQKLEFVGAAIVLEAFHQWKSSCSVTGKEWQRFIGGVDFLAPLKENHEEKLFCLCPLRATEIGTEH